MFQLRRFSAAAAFLAGAFLMNPGLSAAQTPPVEPPPLEIKVDASPSLTYFILDASRSMWGRVGDQTKLEVAKKVLSERFRMSGSQRTALMVYGHRSESDCADIEEIIPIGTHKSEEPIKRINSIVARGKSPISDSILQAAQNVKAFPGKRRIILITDGVEACDKDPCATARSLKAADTDLAVIDVIGFSLDAPETKSLTCIADVTGGAYREVSKADELLATVVAIESPPTPAPPQAAVVINAVLPTPVSATIKKAVPTPVTGGIAAPEPSAKKEGTVILKREAWLLKPYYWRLIDSETGAEAGKYSSFTENVPEGRYLLAWRQYERGSTEIILKDDVVVQPNRITNIDLNTALRLNIPGFVKQPSYWGLRDPESKDELVTFRTFEAFLVPPGQYELIWRQYDDRAETLSFGTIQIEEGKTNYVTLSSSLMIDVADWVPDDPFYWGLRDAATQQWVARYYDGFEAQLVPPGAYTVVYRQSEYGSTDSQLGTVEVSSDSDASFSISTGVRILVDRTQPVPKSVEFAELDSEGKISAVVRLDNVLKPMPLKPARYRISYTPVEHAGTPLVVEDDFELTSGEFAEINLDALLNEPDEEEEDLDLGVPIGDIVPEADETDEILEANPGPANAKKTPSLPELAPDAEILD